MEIKMDILVLTVTEKKDQKTERIAFGGMKSLAKFLKKWHAFDSDEIDFLDMEGYLETSVRSFSLSSIPFTAELPVDL